MARPTDGPTARTERIIVRLTAHEDKLVDKQRGNQTKSEYIRSLIRRDREKSAT